MQQERDTPWSILGWHNPQKMVSFRLASTQFGALLVQMFMSGRTQEGSSKLPVRMPRNCGLAEENPNKCVPQVGQNWRVIRLPLSAREECSASSPITCSASIGAIALTVPFAARCWQSRHQQIRTESGAVASLKVTAPHIQRPVISAILASICRASHNECLEFRWCGSASSMHFRRRHI